MITFLSVLTKVGLHTGLLIASGFALHKFLLGIELRRLIISSAALLTFCVAARLFLLNVELAGGFEHALDFSMFGWVWSPNMSQTLAYLGGAGGVAVGTMARVRILVGLGLAAMVLAVGFGGHSQGLETPGFTPFIISIHVAFAAFWVTAPVVLWPSRSVSDTELLRRLETFSAIAVWGVPLLFISGLWSALHLTGSLGAFMNTAYGLMLLFKILLASMALVIGAANKFWVTRKLRNEPEVGRAVLQKMLIFESVIFSCVICVIALATTVTGPGA